MTNKEALAILKLCYPNGDGIVIEKIHGAFDIAIEALEKQIAKKPSDEYELIAPSFYICGNCNAAIMSKEFSGKDLFFAHIAVKKLIGGIMTNKEEIKKNTIKISNELSFVCDEICHTEPCLSSIAYSLGAINTLNERIIEILEDGETE